MLVIFLAFIVFIEEKSYYEIIILILLILIEVMIGCLFILEFIGHKEYVCDELKMFIKRKDKVIETINREKIINLTKIIDIVTEEVEYIVFKYEGKRKRIKIEENNRNNILSFIENIPFTTKKIIYII